MKCTEVFITSCYGRVFPRGEGFKSDFFSVVMTTAARPTFDPAKGGRERGDLSQLSKQYSSRDLPSHTKLKYRQDTQLVPEDVSSKELKRQLEEKEMAASGTSSRRKRNR